MSVDRRTRLASLAILALVFGSGVLVGVAVDRWAGPPAEAREAEDIDEPREEVAGERQFFLLHEVDLTPEQAAQVDSILDYYRDHMGELVGEYRPRYRALVGETRAAISRVLTAEQQAVYDSLRAARSDADGGRDGGGEEGEEREGGAERNGA